MKNKQDNTMEKEQTNTALTAVDTFNSNEQKGIELATEAFESGKLFADKFRTFAIYARNNLEPKRIPLVLRAAGFSPNRVSDIKGICIAPDEIFKQHEKKEIGFKPVLEAARQVRAARGEKRGRSRAITFADSTPKLLNFLNSIKVKDVEYVEGLNLGLMIFPLRACEKTFTSASGFVATVTITKQA